MKVKVGARRSDKPLLVAVVSTLAYQMNRAEAIRSHPEVGRPGFSEAIANSRHHSKGTQKSFVIAELPSQEADDLRPCLCLRSASPISSSEGGVLSSSLLFLSFTRHFWQFSRHLSRPRPLLSSASCDFFWSPSRFVTPPNHVPCRCCLDDQRFSVWNPWLCASVCGACLCACACCETPAWYFPVCGSQCDGDTVLPLPRGYAPFLHLIAHSHNSLSSHSSIQSSALILTT